jgi:hypothetical protein
MKKAHRGAMDRAFERVVKPKKAADQPKKNHPET